mgnify:CR=1 FL=1
MNKLISVSKAAELLGVCSKTLREWDEEGKLVPIRTKGNHRRYKMFDINIILNNPPEQTKSDKIQVATYCRVSSHEQKQKGDLDRQVGRVLSYCVGKRISQGDLDAKIIKTHDRKDDLDQFDRLSQFVLDLLRHAKKVSVVLG